MNPSAIPSERRQCCFAPFRCSSFLVDVALKIDSYIAMQFFGADCFDHGHCLQDIWTTHEQLENSHVVRF